MKKVSKKIGMMLLVIVMIMVGLPLDTTEVAAKVTNQKAIKAYTKMLSKKYYKWEKYSGSAYKEYDVNKTQNYDFFCIDLNKDGVKELLVCNNIASYAEGYVKIFTYKNGKVKCLLTSSCIEIYKKSMTIAYESRHTGFCWGYFYKMKKKPMFQDFFK